MNFAARSIEPENAALREKIEALGPWFRNLDLGGVMTAPDQLRPDALPEHLGNWRIPNRACAEAMPRASGFAVETRAEDEVYICRCMEMPYAANGKGSVYPATGRE